MEWVAVDLKELPLNGPFTGACISAKLQALALVVDISVIFKFS